ncbi:MAG: phosphoenolpyruvate hydrolase family protein [Azospirillaceae bacterium]|nr:phosphoenolpyruvate hydrolase family protein [Azospirillaceae bacterium]
MGHRFAKRGSAAGTGRRFHGVIVDRIDEGADRPGEDFALLCPHYAGMDAALADLIGSLPVGDANGAILAAIPSCRPGPGLYAGILAADPFRPGPMLLAALKGCGVRAVVNLPTVAMLGHSLGLALSHAGIDYAAELRTLAHAATLGLDAMAVVSTAAQAAAAAAVGIGAIMVHPGPAARDPEVNRSRVAAIAAIVAAVRAIDPGLCVLVFRHPGFDGILDPVGDQADGVVDWAIRPYDGVLAPGSTAKSF